MNSSKQQPVSALDRERGLFRQTTAAVVVLSITGFATYLVPTHSIATQWTYLLHTFVGVMMALTVLPYAWAHVRRVVGVRKPWVMLSGSVAVLTLVALAAGGVHIAVAGQSEAQRWVYTTHVALAMAGVCALGLHVVGHVLSAKRQRRRQESLFVTWDRGIGRSAAFAAGGSALLIALVSALYLALPERYSQQAVVDPYAMPYGNHPFRPSQTETDGKFHFVDERQIAGSKECAICHVDIDLQWRASIHRQAASDRAYVSNVMLLEKRKGIATTRYCEGCHAPVALLTGQLTEGGKHGGIADTAANDEGVSCMTCHGIREAVHLKGVASYRFVPRSDYLFETFDQPLLAQLRRFLIRIQPRQHRADMSPDILAKPELCVTCHAQFMDKDVNGWGWVKMQDDYSAWLKGPYSGQGDHIFANQTRMRCQDCHFPLIAGRDPSANRDGLLRSHFSLGANTAIPWHNGDHEHVERTRDFLQANRINLSIEPPTRLDAKQDQKLVPRRLDENTETPGYFYLGETVTMRLAVANSQVGHDFPGGTADINEAWLEFRVTDSQNDIVFERGQVQGDGTVDERAHFYRTIAIDRMGQDVWRHDLFNMIGERNRNVIKAGGTDIVQYSFTIPTWVKGPLNVTAVVRYRKFNQRYATWALDNPNVRLPIVDMARDALVVPMRERAPVEQVGMVVAP